MFNIKQNNFDAIRLVAAMQVVIVHCLFHFDLQAGIKSLGWLSYFPGVPIFFVVSGFLISSSFKRNPNLADYIYNRFIRIFPALWVSFLFSLLTVYIFHTFEDSGGEILPWVLAQITMGQFYNPEFLRDYGVGVLNGSLWTITVELQFYFVLPLIYYALRAKARKKVFIIFGLLILVSVNQIYYYESYSQTNQSTIEKIVGVTLFPYLYFFMIGVLLQTQTDFVKKFLANRAYYLFGIYVLSIIVMDSLSLPVKGNFLNPISATLLGFLVISVAFSFNEKKVDLTRGYDISYGIYVYHMIFINALVEHSTFSGMVNVLIAISLSIILATASWRYVEKPCLSTKRFSLHSVGNNEN